MKIFKLSYGLMAAAMFTIVSCDINKYPEFDDADAFVAIQTTTASVAENNGKAIEIPVMLTSLSGLSGSVDFTITPAETAGAVEGVNYRIGNTSNTLTFSKESATQNIIIEPIDNDTFGGDVKFTITLTNPQGVDLGANKSCVVTVEDDEHPLAFILGTFTAKGVSYFFGEEEWEVTLSKDADDLSKVWITNLVNGGSSPSTPVYGIVNEEKTQILIPVAQEIATSSGYPHILLEGFYGNHQTYGIDDEHGADGDDIETASDIPSGDNIVGLIAPDGTITIIDWIGSHVYSDDAATASAGWYNIVQHGVVMKKN